MLDVGWCLGSLPPTPADSPPFRFLAMNRRHFLKLSLAATPLALRSGAAEFGPSSADRSVKGLRVGANADRFGEELLIMGGRFDLKVSAKDTGGELCLYDTTRQSKGGPALHLHHFQDEWFYVIRGEFIVRVGDETMSLHPGDSAFAPRKVPHAFAKVSVGATENILMAATLADGTTTLRNAAQEPEVGDLARMLVAQGARIEGIDTPNLTIQGVERLGGCEHAVIPDRIEAGTFLCAVAAACGDVVLERVEPDQIRSVIDLLERCGCVFTERQGAEGRHLRIQRECGQKLRAKDMTTSPYPGFPTDLQAQVMAVMTQATGISVIRETIFENRFQHAMGLERLGANLRIDGGTAIVAGPCQLTGCTVMATDLRASATLVIAGLVAQGETTVDRIYHLDRGYAGLEQKLKQLGARVERVGGGKV